MKRLILIIGILVVLSGLIRSVDAQQTSIVGYGSNTANEIRLVDLETGIIVPSPFDFFTFSVPFKGLAIDPAGLNLYGSDQNGNLYRIEIATGIETPLGNMGIIVPDKTEIEAMDFNGDELWVTDFHSTAPTIYKINNFDTTDPIAVPISATFVQSVSLGIGGTVRTMTADTMTNDPTIDVWIANDSFDFTTFQSVMEFQSIDTPAPPDNPSPNVTLIGFLDDNVGSKPKIQGMDRSTVDGNLYGLSLNGGIWLIDQSNGQVGLIETQAEHSWLALAISTADSSGGSGENNQPPVAEAGECVMISTSQQTGTILNGTATDPDVDDVLQYRWLEGAIVLKDWTTVEGGLAPLDLSLLPLFTIADHTLTLEVSDGTDTAYDEMILTIDNSPPVVATDSGGIYQLGAPITLSGQVSDYDGDIVSYSWDEGAINYGSGSISTLAQESVGIDDTIAVDLPEHQINGGLLSLGLHVLTVSAVDTLGSNIPDSKDISIEVIDTTVPAINVTASKCILWPPNHKLVNIEYQVNATDNSGSVTLSATVTSTEPLNDTGDGNTDYDWTEPVIDQSTGLITLQLRAERKGNGTGRTYMITIRATDVEGNFKETTMLCEAPHDMGKKK